MPIRRPAARARDDGGVALVEFALALPVILLLWLGGMETANYVLVNIRLSQIAQQVADNAGRVRQALDETDINEIMIGAKLMGNRIDFASRGRVILSDLEQRTTTTGPGGQGTMTATNPNGYRQWIRWQRCMGALNKSSTYGGPIDKNGRAVTDLTNTTNTDHGAVQDGSTIDGMGPAGKQIAASGGSAVMVVELFYSYRPLVATYALGSSTIRVVQAVNIRQRTDFSVYNIKKLTGTALSDCTLYNAAVPTS